MPDAWYWSATGSSPVNPTTSNSWTKEDGTTGNPATGDTAFVQPVPGVTNLAPIGFGDMSAVTLANLVISAGLPSTFTIGTTDTTSANQFGYWVIKATLCTIGLPVSSGGSIVQNSSGPGRVKINLSTAASSVNVLSTGTSTDSGFEPVRLLANNSSTTVNIQGGTVGIATTAPGETTTIGTATASGQGTTLDLGPGVTVTTVNIVGGAIGNIEKSPTTLSVGASSTCTTIGTATITTLNNSGTAYVNNRASPAITTLNGYGGSVTDFSGNPAAATVTTFNVYSGASNPVQVQAFQANPGQITVTTTNYFGAGLTQWN